MMRKSTNSKEENNTPVSPGAQARQQQQQQQSGSYSSIVGSLQAQNGTETRAARSENPFQYGKEEMMQVYSSMVGKGDRTSHAPLDFERYEQVTSSTPIQPVSMNELSEDEKALLAGNINSEQKPRRPDQSEPRQNGRRNDRQNGNVRDSKKYDTHRKVSEDARGSQQTIPSNGRGSTTTVEDDVQTTQESSTDPTHETSRGPVSGRNTSRLANMGVFDTNTDPSTTKWKDEKDDDVLKEAMGYTEGGSQDIDRLTDMYQNQNLGSSNQPSNLHNARSYEQQYNPMSTGLPDLFPKPTNPSPAFSTSQQQVPTRGGFMEPAPSPGLQMRHDPPMTRVMVMPDKLKWQYRDPTGQNQGPFSGLEMHDWYKAGFFQPNLLVKREEDEDFEPLSILVRRIGNQREPFLVPLPSRITATNQPARSGSQDGQESWPNGQNWSGGGQPPFPQSFPSFGTTLTAEQQNALERRKQEEQYLMHRQREFLQQQQMAQQMASQRLLHHQHPYGHTGQSYSYGMDRRGSPFSTGSDRHGSMASFDTGAGNTNGSGAGNGGWGGYAPQHHQNAQRGQYTDFGAGIFDTPKSEVAEQSFRETERVVETTRDESKNTMHIGEQSARSSSQTSNNIQNHGQIDYARQVAQQALAARKRAEAAIQPASNAEYRAQPRLDQAEIFATEQPTLHSTSMITSPGAHNDVTTNTQSEMFSNAFPESSSESPVTPSAAPWAAATSAKGKSLREIQELEARRDALRRHAERKAAQEFQTQAELASPRVPEVNVPLNWASESNNESLSTPGAAWKASTPNSGKKTLAQIQQEEESARKAKLALQARVTSQGMATSPQLAGPSMGSRYADLTMKSAGPSWSTVGAGGRVTAPPPIQKTAETKSTSTATAPVFKVRTQAPAPQIVAKPSDPDAISPEFLNWARSALKDLNPGVNFAEFLQLLLSFGTDGGKDTREIISDSIYANSATLDGRRFADEFCKRRKEDLKNTHGQNKSISELTSTLASSSASSNGWSDVVKAKPMKQDIEEDWNSSFKLQAKKGGKRK